MGDALSCAERTLLLPVDKHEEASGFDPFVCGPRRFPIRIPFSAFKKGVGPALLNLAFENELDPLVNELDFSA